MNSLRDKIIFILPSDGRGWCGNESVGDIADKIISLVEKNYSEKPSGLVAIDKNVNEREMSLQEGNELLSNWIYHYQNNQPFNPVLPSGERVEVKK